MKENQDGVHDLERSESGLSGLRRETREEQEEKVEIAILDHLHLRGAHISSLAPALSKRCPQRYMIRKSHSIFIY